MHVQGCRLLSSIVRGVDGNALLRRSAFSVVMSARVLGPCEIWDVAWRRGSRDQEPQRALFLAFAGRRMLASVSAVLHLCVSEMCGKRIVTMKWAVCMREAVS